MYTMVIRRNINWDTRDEVVKRAQAEAFPQYQSADGFVGFYLVTDEKESTNTAILVWESKAHSDKHVAVSKDWWKVLDDAGHTLLSCNEGETTVELQPTK